ncbi:phosphatase PAP2 family protein [Roseiconus nitratireducens]|uniref:Phosphatase PAP2 family protein n=1 Tax=Roseiconus nitratireducens TaxID=2605748 RepID=A0A5M6DIQ1_9BACT|nr:phosphatase PAP2 family protein [Roseiconus nitratireducens]KAA5545145.1 phosphatase PAP2 family protein [Roseiconus nitratireducens]
MRSEAPRTFATASPENRCVDDDTQRPRIVPAFKPIKSGSFPLAALLWTAGLLLLSVPMVTLIDIPVARWFATDPFPREINNALELTRVFSHGSGIFVILVGIFLMAPHRRWHLPKLATLAIGAGAVATLAKMFVLRPRPTGLNLNVASHDSAWLWAFDWTLSQVATFDASTRAFPSGNMATAIALTVGLWTVLPRGRWLFAAICLGTMVQRLACSAHFPSDILGGAAFGLLWAYVCVHPKLLGNLFDKMQPESEPRRRPRPPEPERKQSDPPPLDRRIAA